MLNQSDFQLSNFGFFWLAYLGGSHTDGLISLAKDKYNNIYVAGSSRSSDFPVSSIRQKYNSGSDIIVLKFSFDGQLIWGAVLGSDGDDYLFSIAYDSTGNIWGCGESRGLDFPITPNAVQKSFAGNADGVVFKLDSNGILLYSTYFGGYDYEGLTHIVANIDNTIWISGRTRSQNFPLTPNAKDKTLNEEYKTPIIHFDQNGNLLYSSFFGG